MIWISLDFIKHLGAFKIFLSMYISLVSFHPLDCLLFICLPLHVTPVENITDLSLSQGQSPVPLLARPLDIKHLELLKHFGTIFLH